MFNARVLFLAGILFLPPATCLAAEPDMQDGKWEMTMKMEMPGMPFAIPPVKSVTCITRENPVPQPESMGKECTMTKMQMKGNTVTWAADCKDADGGLHTEGEITYRGNSFDGTIRSTMKSAEGEMPMTQKISGKRLGPCQ
jgi:hypothetical protein